MIYAALVLLIIIVAWEWSRNVGFAEGFTDGVVPEFFGRYFPRRYDVVPGQQREEGGWVRNTRYFEGYVDLQRLGYKGDFCRVVEKENMPESRMLACALAGQEGLDSMTYRSESSRAGMKFSRDDYFRDVDGDGREDYGRILKVEQSPNDRWEARALIAGQTRFKQGNEIMDPNPPAHIADLLWFYEGVMVWFRFFDDMLDYAENAQIKIAGEAKVDETPARTTTRGLELNKYGDQKDQYLKLGENPQLEFDNTIQIRKLRALSVWVYFEEFTQNARIFDFGNGAGKDNVLLGIEGKGNDASDFGKLGARPNASNRVCQTRPAKELSPQNFLKTTEANLDEWECPGPEPVDTMFPEDEDEGPKQTNANLLFEIWDTQQRKMRMRVLNVIPLKKWTHIAITTTDGNSMRPTWHVYINGNKVYEEQNGHVPLKSYLTQNYIGRSNWEGVTSQYQDADERFKGALFDFRLYRLPLSQEKVERTVAWGRSKLGVTQSRDE